MKAHLMERKFPCPGLCERWTADSKWTRDPNHKDICKLCRRIWESRRRRGFTLIELMIVVVVMCVLAAIAIPKFSELRKNFDREACADGRQDACDRVAKDGGSESSKRNSPAAAPDPCGQDFKSWTQLKGEIVNSEKYVEGGITVWYSALCRDDGTTASLKLWMPVPVGSKVCVAVSPYNGRSHGGGCDQDRVVICP